MLGSNVKSENMTNEDYEALITGKFAPDAETRESQRYLLTEGLKLLDPADHMIDPAMSLMAKLYNYLPAYFFETPASSSGKYHPAFANTAHGLVLHTVAAMKYAAELFDIVALTPTDKNVIILSLFAHDMLKYGNPENYAKGCPTVHAHPELACEFLKFLSGSTGITDDERCLVNMMMDLVASHMGRWTTSKYSTVVLKAPKTQMELICHKADYFASKKEPWTVEGLY